MAKIPNYTLNDGNQIPVLGFGTYKLNGATGVNAINSALNNGYSLLDSAFNYENKVQSAKQSDVHLLSVKISS